VGDLVEEHVQVVNPEERHYVAVVVPLAAGMEPLNPKLATASSDATAAGVLTLEPTYTAFLDDRLSFYYDTLPKGTFDFYFRARAIGRSATGRSRACRRASWPRPSRSRIGGSGATRVSTRSPSCAAWARTCAPGGAPRAPRPSPCRWRAWSARGRAPTRGSSA